MTLLVDATTAEHARGIGTVINGLLSEASGIAPAGTVVVAGPASEGRWELSTTRVGLARTRSGRVLYQRLLLPLHVERLQLAGHPIDRVLALDSYVPVIRPDRRIRYAALVHDTLPLTHPEFWRPAERALKRSAFWSLRHSRAELFTSTKYTAHEIYRRLGKRARVVAFGCGQLSDAEADSALGSPLRLPEEKLIYVGALEPRKKVLLLLELYERFRRTGPTLQLTLVGDGRRSYQSMIEERIATSPFGHDIEVVRNASRCATLDLISRARALLLPSAVEGFGLPIAEALALGTPVVARDLPMIRAWAGDAVTYARDEPDEWVAAITRASELSDAERRSGQSAVRAHRWRSCAEEMLNF